MLETGSLPRTWLTILEISHFLPFEILTNWRFFDLAHHNHAFPLTRLAGLTSLPLRQRTRSAECLQKGEAEAARAHDTSARWKWVGANCPDGTNICTCFPGYDCKTSMHHSTPCKLRALMLIGFRVAFVPETARSSLKLKSEKMDLVRIFSVIKCKSSLQFKFSGGSSNDTTAQCMCKRIEWPSAQGSVYSVLICVQLYEKQECYA